MNEVISYYNLQLDTDAIKLCKKIEKTVKKSDCPTIFFIEKTKNLDKQFCNIKETVLFYIFSEIFKEFLQISNDVCYDIRVISYDDIMRSIKANKDILMFLKSLRKNKKDTKSPSIIGKVKRKQPIKKRNIEKIVKVKNIKSI